MDGQFAAIAPPRGTLRIKPTQQREQVAQEYQPTLLKAAFKARLVPRVAVFRGRFATLLILTQQPRNLRMRIFQRAHEPELHWQRATDPRFDLVQCFIVDRGSGRQLLLHAVVSVIIAVMTVIMLGLEGLRSVGAYRDAVRHTGRASR